MYNSVTDGRDACHSKTKYVHACLVNCEENAAEVTNQQA